MITNEVRHTGEWKRKNFRIRGEFKGIEMQIADTLYCPALLGILPSKDAKEYSDFCEASAKLIAVAPDLLYELQAAIRLFEIEYERDAHAGKEPQTPLWVIGARAVIKKATE